MQSSTAHGLPFLLYYRTIFSKAALFLKAYSPTQIQKAKLSVAKEPFIPGS